MIFPQYQNKPLSINERRSELEKLKELANKVLKENKEYNETANDWEKRVVEENIYNLKYIIQNLNKDLKNEAISRFVSASNLNADNNIVSITTETLEASFKEIMGQSRTFSILPDISSNTLFASIHANINKAVHVNVDEITRISLKLETPTILEKYVPDAIASLDEKIISFDPTNIDLGAIIPVLRSAMKLSTEKEYSSSNILLITSLEAISLKILEYSLTKQNSTLSPDEIENEIYNKYGSLKKLIKKIKLDYDYPIKYIDAAIRYKHSTSRRISEMKKKFHLHIKTQNLLKDRMEQIINNHQKFLESPEKSDVKFQKLHKEEQSKLIESAQKLIDNCDLKDFNQTENINIAIELEFLTNKIYDERNLILHGQFEKIENSWKNYFYLLGVYRLFILMNDYK